jgi:hypothetical protein
VSEKSPVHGVRDLSGTHNAKLGGTGRSSAAGTPNRAARDDSTRNRRHEPTGLITQRSLVQIQPAQRNRRSQGVSERSGALRVCT